VKATPTQRIIFIGPSPWRHLEYLKWRILDSYHDDQAYAETLLKDESLPYDSYSLYIGPSPW